MKKYVGALALLVLFAAGGNVSADKMWTDDFEEAKARAKAENRFMLLDFTGSDWCGWCIKLDKEVFSQKEFKKYAEEKLVCVVVDFPSGKSLSSKTQKQNEELKQQFRIGGYPTIILLDPKGEKVAQTGYKAGGAENYVKHLEDTLAPFMEKAGPVTTQPVGAAAGGPMSARAMRTWTSLSGSTVEASYEQRVGNIIQLRKPDGKMMRIDTASLSAADQEFLRSIKAMP